MDDKDGQHIISYCLAVDRLIDVLALGKTSSNNNKSNENEARIIHVLNLKSGDEEAAAKHLRVFLKLKDLGFEDARIHEALITCDNSHDKALEQLLK